MSRGAPAERRRPAYEEAEQRLRAHALLGPVARHLQVVPLSRRRHAERSRGLCWVEPPGIVCLNDSLRLDADAWLAILALATLAHAIGGPTQLPWPDPVTDMAVTLTALHWWGAVKVGALPAHVEPPAAMAALGRLALGEIAAHLRALPPDHIADVRWLLTGSAHDPWIRPPPRTAAWAVGADGHRQRFVNALFDNAQHALRLQHEGRQGPAGSAASRSTAAQARRWLFTHHPLLAPLLARIELVEDPLVCQRLRIQIAAIHVGAGEIYINPAFRLGLEKAKFVIAHEVLHAGLCHHSRRRGRDPYLWNVACDFVINDWLVSMGVGTPPDAGLLFDEGMRGWAAEDIYQRLAADLRIR